MTNLYPWAMLATNYDDVYVNYPVYVQPKLNGVRAKWDVQLKLLVSRQGKVIPESVLPELYSNLKINYKEPFSLDGELFSYDLPFQELCGVVNGKRKTPHDLSYAIHFFAFDIISDEKSLRQPNWKSRICSELCSNEEEFKNIQHFYKDNKYYDGLILRVSGAPYIVGRTEALIKWKPWKYADILIINCLEGIGKFKDMLGAFEVKWNNKKFKVGGGNITEKQRQDIWESQELRQHNRWIQIRYRELSRDGIPLQPQIVKL